jgi:hypothetical protein
MRSSQIQRRANPIKIKRRRSTLDQWTFFKAICFGVLIALSGWLLPAGAFAGSQTTYRASFPLWMNWVDTASSRFSLDVEFTVVSKLAGSIESRITDVKTQLRTADGLVLLRNSNSDRPGFGVLTSKRQLSKTRFSNFSYQMGVVVEPSEEAQKAIADPNSKLPQYYFLKNKMGMQIWMNCTDVHTDCSLGLVYSGLYITATPSYPMGPPMIPMHNCKVGDTHPSGQYLDQHGGALPNEVWPSFDLIPLAERNREVASERKLNGQALPAVKGHEAKPKSK